MISIINELYLAFETSAYRTEYIGRYHIVKEMRDIAIEFIYGIGVFQNLIFII